MGDFFQNGTIATLHDFDSRTTEELEAELKLFSAYRPMEIVLPCLFSELEGDASAHVSEELVSPNPCAVGDEFTGQWIHSIVVRALGRKVPRFKALEPQVEREGGVWEALGPANLDVVRQPAIRHDA